MVARRELNGIPILGNRMKGFNLFLWLYSVPELNAETTYTVMSFGGLPYALYQVLNKKPIT